MRCLSKIFLFLFLIRPVTTTLSQTVDSPGFEVHSGNQKFSAEIDQVLEEGYRKAWTYFDFNLPEKITVYVTANSEEFDRLVSGTLPDWSIACAIPERNLIVLKSPDRYHYRKNLAEVLKHELAHIFLGKYFDADKIPTWMNEGYAVWFSESWGWEERILVARAVLTGSVPKLSQLDSLGHFRQSKAQLGYALSFLALSYLESQYGQRSFKEIIDHYSKTGDWDQAFLQVAGLEYEMFQKEFEQMVRKRYNWAAILTDGFVIWTGLALLFILLYLIKRRRNRRIIQRWEKEEQGLAPRDFDIY